MREPSITAVEIPAEPNTANSILFSPISHQSITSFTGNNTDISIIQKPITQRINNITKSTKNNNKYKFYIVNIGLCIVLLLSWTGSIVVFSAELERVTVTQSYITGYDMLTNTYTYTDTIYIISA